MSPRTKLRPARLSVAVAALATAAFVVFAPRLARADDTIKHPGDHPVYNVEAEPHLVLGWDNVYASGGYGVGGRFTIPIVHNGFVDTINDSVGIGFGLDIMHYDECRYGLNGCGANYVFVPVVMQWNFFVASRWSVFGEPGLELFHGFVNDCAPGVRCDGGPNVNGVRPALYIGGRYHLSETVSLTMRIGWPAFTFGVSFFP